MAWFNQFFLAISIGVKSRLATLTIDMSDLTKLANVGNRSDLPAAADCSTCNYSLPAIFNSLYARRAIIPAANGHCSARALACYYDALAEGGIVPPPHYSSIPT